jgi:superfamily I DNA/RNA helicase
MIAKNAAGQDGVFLAPGEAQEHLSNIKLRSLMTADKYSATIDETSNGLSRTLAALYEAYKGQQREGSWMDYDDQILLSLRLLGDDSPARRKWQQQWHCLLVDEYQDIEPAQELLVRILAAPEDQLLCVGDEEQTLYAFRRASVQRIICLDELYPALERIALAVNYRCPHAVVTASARLVRVNEIRFPKPISASAGEQPDAIALCAVTRCNDAAAAVAQTLASRQRGEIVVLARTTNALRPVALACADQGVKIDGPPKLFTPKGARLALQRHLQLVVEQGSASAELVRAVCQTPGRGIKDANASMIAAALRAGVTFSDAFADVKAPVRGGGKLLAPGDLFAALADCESAPDGVALLREEGGLDEWFAENDSMSGTDRFEFETLVVHPVIAFTHAVSTLPV